MLLASARDLGPDQEMAPFIGCLEQDTVLRLFLTPFLDQTGPLSAESSGCLRQSYADAELAALFLEAASGPSEDPGAAMGRMMTSLFVTFSCLNEEEFRAAAPALGMAPEEQQTLQCVRDELGGPEGLAALLQPDAGPSLELFGALSDCELQLGGPTPTLPEVLVPLSVTDSEAFLSEVSEAEQACLSANVDTDRLSMLLARAMSLAPDEEMAAFIGCLEQDTVLRLFLTPFLGQTGPLSAESSACLRQSYADADLAALFLAAASGPSEDPGAAMGRMMASLLVTFSCLNEEEFRAAGPALGMAPEDWQTLQCVQDELGGPDGLAALLQPDAGPPLELLGAVSGCDLQLGGGPTPTPTPTPTATPTPTPTATPTPTPISYVLYENQELGASFQRPEQWATAEPPSDEPDEPDVSDEPEDPDEPEPPIEWAAFVGDDGLSRLTLLTQFDEPDAPLSDRLDRAVAPPHAGRGRSGSRAQRFGYAR